MKIADLALNAFFNTAPEILARLGTACISGGILTLIVWGICTAFRPPSVVRVWLWWLVGIRFLTGLLPAIALTVALPHDSVPAPVLRPLNALRATLHPESKPTKPAPVAANESTPVAEANSALTMDSSIPARPAFDPAMALVCIYAAGLLFLLCQIVEGAVRIRRIVREATPIVDTDILDLLGEGAQANKLRRAPQLLESSAVAAPLVTGMIDPVIVLPTGFAERVPPDALHLALLHETAHIRRGDLWWGLFPCAARVLFWWFPLAYIACREWEQAREEACDSAAVAIGQTSPLAYGRLLVMLATGEPLRAVTMANLAAPGFSTLKRRLTALRRGSAPLSRRQRWGVAILFAGLVAGILPCEVRAILPFAEPIAAFSPMKPPLYEVVPLGTLGGQYSDACAINDDGQVAGAASLGDKQGRGHAFLASADDVPIDLSIDSDFPRSIAFGINNSGSIAATAFYRTGKPQAFFWDGKRHYLGTLPGFGYSRAVAVNDDGIVVGNALRFRRQWGAVQAHAWIWRNGLMRDMGTLGGAYSHAAAINNRGQVVGKSDLPRVKGSDGVTHAFVWDSLSGMHDLGTLGGVNSRAQGINESGEIVGVSDTPDSRRMAFVATVDGRMSPMPSLPGASECVANAISATGQAVGVATLSENDTRAVFWQRQAGQPGGQPVDLNTCIPPDSGWRLLVARGINARGEIVGQGEWQGKRLAFLLRPVQ